MTDDRAVQLPDAFSDLNRFVQRWANGSMAEQYAARLSSNMNEMQEFYDAMKPRILDIRAYLDAIDFKDYAPPDIALAQLVYGWVPVAEAVEVFKQVIVPDSKMYWEIVESPSSF